jgi:GT2 family glycosyltransferase
LAEVAADQPGAVVQGATRPDPFENAVATATHYRSLHVDPPNLFAQTCNIAYPKPLLERLEGFDEKTAGKTAGVGEDTDLALRAKGLGAQQVGAPNALVFHAVESYSLLAAIRGSTRWQHMAYLVRRHPQLRDDYVLRIFWRPTHFELLLGLVGIAGCRRSPVTALLALPYLRRALAARGRRRRQRAASAYDLPGRVVVDLAEIAILARGSVRHRTLLL